MAYSEIDPDSVPHPPCTHAVRQSLSMLPLGADQAGRHLQRPTGLPQSWSPDLEGYFQLDLPALGPLFCHESILGCRPPGGWGTCGAEPPERPNQDRMTQTCGKSFVCAVLCHRVWGALLQDLNCPPGRPQNGCGIFLFPSLAFLLSCLCSGKATSFKCQSHTQRGKVTQGGPDMQDEWYLSCSGFPGVCTLFPFCMGTCSNSRVRRWTWG